VAPPFSAAMAPLRVLRPAGSERGIHAALVCVPYALWDSSGDFNGDGLGDPAPIPQSDRPHRSPRERLKVPRWVAPVGRLMGPDHGKAR
jgi:hypothetical protein